MLKFNDGRQDKTKAHMTLGNMAKSGYPPKYLFVDA